MPYFLLNAGGRPPSGDIATADNGMAADILQAPLRADDLCARSGNWRSSTASDPGVGESAFGKIARFFPYTAPYEDITPKGGASTAGLTVKRVGRGFRVIPLYEKQPRQFARTALRMPARLDHRGRTELGYGLVLAISTGKRKFRVELRSALPAAKRSAFTAAGVGRRGGTRLWAAAAGPQGQLTWGVHISLAPTWFDPAEDAGDHHPVHGDVRAARRGGEADARKSAGAVPWPESYSAVLRMASSTSSFCAMASSFTMAIPVTAVGTAKFSFERYRGTSHDLMQERMASSRPSTRGASALP